MDEYVAPGSAVCGYQCPELILNVTWSVIAHFTSLATPPPKKYSSSLIVPAQVEGRPPIGLIQVTCLFLNQLQWPGERNALIG